MQRDNLSADRAYTALREAAAATSRTLPKTARGRGRETLLEE
jgi:hypothetical protein